MNAKNRELLEEVIKERLEGALNSSEKTEESKTAFKEAMVAIDRQIELSKMDDSYREQVEKRELEEKKQIREDEFKEKESKWNKIIRGAEIGVPLIALGIELVSKFRFMKNVCNFEKDYSFTTTPGRSLSSYFRWKK